MTMAAFGYDDDPIELRDAEIERLKAQRDALATALRTLLAETDVPGRTKIALAINIRTKFQAHKALAALESSAVRQEDSDGA